MKAASDKVSAIPRGRQWRGATIPLGPLTLNRLLGCGGMAEVWAATHRRSGRQVAVKVMMGDMAKDPAFVATFRREVQTVAALDHPSIVMVLDYGRVPAASARISDGRLTADSPYLVMELAQGGDLVTRWANDPLEWAGIRAVILALLGGLAHAHARGVIHRDIKGDNLLWFPHQQRWKLADFGIAHALARSGESRIVGTPQYMAPEQFACAWRDYGPWTDLYAAGCLFFEMVSGRLPFDGEDAAELGDKHLKWEVPALEPRVAVPPGFEHWLRHLLAKHPVERFRFAADARRALVDLGQPASPRAPGRSERPWAHRPGSLILAEGHEEMRARWAKSLDVGLPSKAATHPEASAVASTWRKRPRGRPFLLRGSGLGLYGLRTVPIAGRIRERNELWATLKEVDHRGRAEAIVLHGAAGTGKSRLARWLCEEAHETGSADVMRVALSELPTGALAGLASSTLRCEGLGHRGVLRRIRTWFRSHGGDQAWEWETLADLIAPPDDRGHEAYQPPAELQIRRFGALARMLALASRARPVVVWVDDVQWGAEVLEFVQLVLKTQKARPVRVLFVLTVRDESLGSLEARHLDALWHQGAHRLRVDPLREAAGLQLVANLLGLSGDLASRVARHTGGNPLFAVQIVGDWVWRGVLEQGERGLQLREGEQISLPDTMRGMWIARVDEVLGGRRSDDRDALEIAAAMGNECDALAWASTCARAAVSPSDDLIDELVQRRLAVWTEEGWRFVHGMLRASFEHDSREAGRWAAHNLAYAEMLAQNLDHDGHGDRYERLGRTWMEAGEPERAVEALLRGARQRAWLGQYAAAELLLQLRDDALTAAKVPARDPRWGDGWIARARVCSWQSRTDEAAEWVERTHESARLHEWSALMPDVLAEKARVLNARGELTEGIAWYQAAVTLFERQRNVLGMAHAKLRLGHTLILTGRLSEAENLLLEAKGTCDAEYDLEGIIVALVNLASIHVAQKDYDKAREAYLTGLRHYEARHDRLGVLQCRNGLAEIDRALGHYDEAAAVYRELIVEWESMGSSWLNYGLINLGLCLLNQRRFEEAEALLTDVTRDARRKGQFALLGGVHAELMPCVAARGDWEGWDQHQEVAERYLEITGVADYDDAWPLQLAGQMAAEAGQLTRARRAFEIARGLWVRLDDADRLTEIDAALADVDRRLT